MKATSYSKMKRVLALILTICMVMSGMSLQAFALGEGDSTEPTGSDWQIMVGTDKEEVNFGAGSEADGVNTSVNNALVTASTKGGKVKATKSIAPTDEENVFNITLQVETKQEFGEDLEDPAAAVALVMDISSSMKDGTTEKTVCSKCEKGDKLSTVRVCSKCNSENITGSKRSGYHCNVCNKDNVNTKNVTKCGHCEEIVETKTIKEITNPRLSAAKEAAIDFIDSLVENAPSGAERWVCLVPFSTEVYSDGHDWVDVNTTDGYSQIIQEITNLEVVLYTNLPAGLNQAHTMLQGKSSLANRFAVTFTDGAPTSKNHYPCDEYMCDQSRTAAAKITSAGIPHYSICFDAKDDVCYTKNNKAVTVGDFLGSISTNVYYASEASQISTSFQSISHLIALMTEAWTVTDPMGENIIYKGLVTTQGDACVTPPSDSNDQTLMWDLKSDGSFTVSPQREENQSAEEYATVDKTYTYTLTYQVALDTNAKGFEENKFYPTNGFTSLSYVFYNKDLQITDESGKPLANQDTAEANILPFTVPGVKGKIPEYTFEVEHYVKDESGYPDDPTDTDEGGYFDRWTEFAAATYKDPYLAELGANYQIDSYRFIEGTETNSKEKIELVEDSVLKIYYSRVPVTVTVNKFLRNDTIDAAGTRTSTAYTGLGSENYTVGKGSSFTVPTDFLESYALVDTEKEHSALTAEENLISDSTTIETVNGGEVINLYYYTELNQAAVEVYRTFEEWGYKFNETTKKFDTEMTCLKKWTEKSPIASAAEVVFPGNGYTYTIPAEAENATEYEYVNGSALLDQNKVSDANNQVIVKPDTNKTYRVDVTYKKSADNRGPLYTVQVKHNYTYNEYKIINGALSKEPEVTEYPDIQNAQVDIVKGYKGEVATLKEQPVYDGVTYTPTAQNAENGVVNGVLPYTFGEGAVYNLYYTKDVYPKTTGATVISEFYTLTPIINTTTGAITYDENLDDTKRDIYPEKNADYVLYEGQKFIGPEPDHTGYPTVDKANNNVIKALDIDPTKNVIVLKYYRNSYPDPETAQAKIIHNYYSRFTAVIDGKVTTTDYALDASEQYNSGYGEAGDEYTGFDFIRENGGYEYTEEDPEQNLTAIYGGKTVVVNYYREYENLEPISINVIHNYYTRHMSVKEVNGVLTADYFEDGIELDGSSKEFVLLQDGKEVTDLYKNMVVDIKLEKTYDGQAYELEANTLYLDIQVTEDGKTYILNYFKDDELGKVQPTVTHTYYDINYDYVEGVEQEPKTVENKDLASTVTGNEDYVGLTYDAATSSMGYKLVKCVVNGEEVALDTLKDGKYVLTLAADKANKVEYTYEKINNKLEEASIVVQHYYTTIDDYTGTVTGYVPGEDYTPLRYETKSYATMSFTASHNHLDGEFPDEPTSDREQTVVLVPGDNGVINLYYERHFSSRAKVSAVENHSYFVYDKYTDVTTEVEELNWSKETKDLWEGENFSATPDIKGDYEMQTAEDDLTIVLLADSELNVVNVKYLKTIDTTPEAPHTPHRPHKPEEPEVPETPVVPEVPAEPETPVEPEEPEIIEVLEPEVPLAEMPEVEEPVEIFEEEVPLADVPTTGDNSVVWLILSVLAALGLAVLTIEEKKARQF